MIWCALLLRVLTFLKNSNEESFAPLKMSRACLYARFKFNEFIGQISKFCSYTYFHKSSQLSKGKKDFWTEAYSISNKVVQRQASIYFSLKVLYRFSTVMFLFNLGIWNHNKLYGMDLWIWFQIIRFQNSNTVCQLNLPIWGDFADCIIFTTQYIAVIMNLQHSPSWGSSWWIFKFAFCNAYSMAKLIPQYSICIQPKHHHSLIYTFIFEEKRVSY